MCYCLKTALGGARGNLETAWRKADLGLGAILRLLDTRDSLGKVVWCRIATLALFSISNLHSFWDLWRSESRNGL